VGHLDQRILDALLNHRLSPAEVSRLKEHIAGCRECSRRIEEWRDQFPAVESVIPTIERSTIHSPQRSGPVQILLPWHARRGTGRDLTRYLLPLGIIIAMAAAFFARRMSRAGPATVHLTERTNTPGLTLPTGEAPSAIPAPQAVKPTMPAIPPERPAAPKPRAEPKVGARPATEADHPKAAPDSAPPRPFTETPKPPVVSSAPGFRPVEIAQAERALDGPVRLVDGWTPVRIELGDGAAVPGADTAQPVVRVVYLDGRVLLDQQVSTAPPSDTLAGSTPRGVTVLRWTNNRRWLSLAGVLSRDSLEAILRRVH
jgi:anti-sigma factor RsiW